MCVSHCELVKTKPHRIPKGIVGRLLKASLVARNTLNIDILRGQNPASHLLVLVEREKSWKSSCYSWVYIWSLTFLTYILQHLCYSSHLLRLNIGLLKLSDPNIKDIFLLCYLGRSPVSFIQLNNSSWAVRVSSEDKRNLDCANYPSCSSNDNTSTLNPGQNKQHQQ